VVAKTFLDFLFTEGRQIAKQADMDFVSPE
jgi:hypothetical protein